MRRLPNIRSLQGHRAKGGGGGSLKLGRRGCQGGGLSGGGGGGQVEGGKAHSCLSLSQTDLFSIRVT